MPDSPDSPDSPDAMSPTNSAPVPVSPPQGLNVVKFSYWTDPLCIWAFVGQVRLDSILRTHGALLRVDHRIVPVFGSVPERFTRGSWADAGPRGRVEATARIAREFGREDVSGEIWLTDPPASSWAPGLAAAAVLALERAQLVLAGTTGAYLAELRRSLFVDNVNTARRHQQMACAERCSIDRGEIELRLDDGSAHAILWQEYADKQAMGVRGSPTYEFDGGRELLYGNVREHIVRATIDALGSGGLGGRSDCS